MEYDTFKFLRISNIQKQLLFQSRKSYRFNPSFFCIWLHSFLFISLEYSSTKKFYETFVYIFGGVLVRFQVRIFIWKTGRWRSIVPKRLVRKIDIKFLEIHARYIKRHRPARLGKMYTGVMALEFFAGRTVRRKKWNKKSNLTNLTNLT